MGTKYTIEIDNLSLVPDSVIPGGPEYMFVFWGIPGLNLLPNLRRIILQQVIIIIRLFVEVLIWAVLSAQFREFLVLMISFNVKHLNYFVSDF